MVKKKNMGSRILNFIKSYARFGVAEAYQAAFFIPIIIMVIIFVAKEIYPFGENCFLRTDMYHQYAPFFSEFQYKLQNGGSLFYSWNIGMGINFSALYAYYLASPLNWFVFFVSKNHIIEFMTFLIVLKSGLAGLSMTYYLRHHNIGVTQVGQRPRFNFSACYFGIFYALSGYMAAYTWNLMWLDCIVLFPLVCLGAEKLITEKKFIMYTLCLGMCILSNYYISIMICLFMVFYAIAMAVLRGKTRLKDFFITVGQFAFFSILAAGLACIVLFPEIYALQTTASSNIDFPKTYSSYFSIIDMLARHMPNVSTEQGLDHWPNIYCGVAIYLLIIMYMANSKIRVKEKAIYITLSVFMLAGFAINILNYIWHGLHYPNSLPARQSFIYIFLLLLMGYRAIYEWKGISPKKIGVALVTSIAFVLLCQEFIDSSDFTFSVYYLSLGLLAIYGLLLYLYKIEYGNRKIIFLVALLVVAVEAAVNTTITSVTTTSRTAYLEDNADVIELVEEVSQGVDNFARFEKISRKSKDDGAWMNYPSVSLFSSTADASLSDFFKKIGCEGSTNSYCITGATPFVDALFNVKYAIYTSTRPDDDMKKLVSAKDKALLYENPYTFGMGFLIDESIADSWNLDLNNAAYVQNDFATLFGVDDLLVYIDDTYENGRDLSFMAPEDGQYYVYVKTQQVDSVTAIIPSRSSDEVETGYFDTDREATFKNVKRGYLLELGHCYGGSTVTVRCDEEDEAMTGLVFRFDYDSLAELEEKISEGAFNLTALTDTKVVGTVESGKEQLLFMSIPYDDGWKVTVDGQEVETQKLFGAFMGIPVSAGSHEIVMSYMPEGFLMGAAITLISAVNFVLLGVHTTRKADEDFDEDIVDDNAADYDDLDDLIFMDGAYDSEEAYDSLHEMDGTTEEGVEDMQVIDGIASSIDAIDASTDENIGDDHPDKGEVHEIDEACSQGNASDTRETYQIDVARSEASDASEHDKTDLI